MNTNRLSRIIVLAITLMISVGNLFPTGFAKASTFRSSDNIHVTNLHEIDDDFYATGEYIIIDGVITGDLFSASYKTEIKGEIGRSANLCCRLINHRGRIDGSLRSFAQRITISGFVGGSVLAAGSSIDFETGSIIEHDANIYGNDISLDGEIKGDVECSATTVHITGIIDGDVKIEAKRIIISPPAVIRGNLTYTADTESALETGTGVTVMGEVRWLASECSDEEDEGNLLKKITVTISSFLAALLFGIIVVKLFKPYAEESFRQLRNRFTTSLAAGFLGLILLVICIVTLSLSFILALVGLGMLSGELVIVGVAVLAISILMIPITSFASVSGVILLYCGAIICGFLLGFVIIRLLKPGARQLSSVSLLLGLAVMTLLFELPYVGNIIHILATLAGAGAIILGIRHSRRNNDRTAAATTSLNPRADEPQ